MQGMLTSLKNASAITSALFLASIWVLAETVLRVGNGTMCGLYLTMTKRNLELPIWKIILCS